MKVKGMDRAEVNITGTPIRYWVDPSEVSFDGGDYGRYYCPGDKVHTCLGVLVVEEVVLAEDGRPYKVLCSVPRQPQHHKEKQGIRYTFRRL